MEADAGVLMATVFQQLQVTILTVLTLIIVLAPLDKIAVFAASVSYL